MLSLYLFFDMLLFVAIFEFFFYIIYVRKCLKYIHMLRKLVIKHYLAYSYMFNQPVMETESPQLSWPVGVITMT